MVVVDPVVDRQIAFGSARLTPTLKMSLDLTSRRNARRSATFSVGALALVPFASLPFPPTLRLPAQAVMILALLAAQLPWLREPARPLPSLLRFGLAAWTLAAAWGTLVGLLSGNPLRYVTGQSLSMLMMPLAALIFWLRSGFSTRTLLRGLAAAVVLALAMHLLLPVFGLESSGSGPVASNRLPVAPGVSFIGSALLVGLLCVGGLRGSGGGRLLVAAGAVAAGALVIGGFSRGQWLAGIVGLATLVITTLGARRRVWYFAAGGVGLVVVLAALYARLATDPIPLASDAQTWSVGGGGSAQNQELAHLEWDDAAGARVSARVHGPAGETLRLWTEAAPAETSPDDGGSRRTSTAVRRVETSPGDLDGNDSATPVQTIVAVPSHSRELRVGVWVSGGLWTIEDLRVQSIGSGLATWIRGWTSRPTSVAGQEPTFLVTARRRVQQLIWAFADPTSDVTVSQRAGESAAAFSAWRQENWPRRLIGAGLGATIDHAIPTVDAKGERVVVEQPSYLHNYYLFLLYKLGLFGILPFAAQIAFAVQALLLGRRHGWLGHAAFAAWLAYALWSLSSPEILDFRRAVLWGLLIAACGRAEISSRPFSFTETPRLPTPGLPGPTAWRRVLGGREQT